MFPFSNSILLGGIGTKGSVYDSILTEVIFKSKIFPSIFTLKDLKSSIKLTLNHLMKVNKNRLDLRFEYHWIYPTVP